MALDNLDYKVSLWYDYLGQNCLNVFWYRRTFNSGTSPSLLTVFRSAIVPLVVGVVSNQVQFQEVRVDNAVDPLDFDSYVYASQVGSRTGTPTPAHLAWSFTYVVGRGDAKSGGKRFAGITESDMDNGLPSGGVIVALNNLAVNIGDVLIAPDTTRFTPRIVGRRGTVRPWPDELYSNQLAAVNFLGITSQNSRKFYTSPGR